MNYLNELFEFIASDKAYTFKFNSRKNEISKTRNKICEFPRKKNIMIWVR